MTNRFVKKTENTLFIKTQAIQINTIKVNCDEIRTAILLLLTEIKISSRFIIRIP
jgi:hypothetical protein